MSDISGSGGPVQGSNINRVNTNAEEAVEASGSVKKSTEPALKQVNTNVSSDKMAVSNSNLAPSLEAPEVQGDPRVVFADTEDKLAAASTEENVKAMVAETTGITPQFVKALEEEDTTTLLNGIMALIFEFIGETSKSSREIRKKALDNQLDAIQRQINKMQASAATELVLGAVSIGVSLYAVKKSGEKYGESADMKKQFKETQQTFSGEDKGPQDTLMMQLQGNLKQNAKMNAKMNAEGFPDLPEEAFSTDVAKLKLDNFNKQIEDISKQAQNIQTKYDTVSQATKMLSSFGTQMFQSGIKGDEKEAVAEAAAIDVSKQVSDAELELQKAIIDVTRAIIRSKLDSLNIVASGRT